MKNWWSHNAALWHKLNGYGVTLSCCDTLTSALGTWHYARLVWPPGSDTLLSLVVEGTGDTQQDAMKLVAELQARLA